MTKYNPKFTKIVATLGPASCQRIEELVQSGVDVFRINCSHGTPEEWKDLIHSVRQAEKNLQKITGIIADLQGPKLRVGVFKNGAIQLKQGQQFILDSNPEEGNEERVYFSHFDIFPYIKPHTTIRLDDGLIALRIEEVRDHQLITTVLHPGSLSNRKGVNILQNDLPIETLTTKDQEDIRHLQNTGIDWIALSFIRTPECIENIRKMIHPDIGIIAKIETHAAIDNLELIIQSADAVMIARGDLGVELPIEDVPILQNRIIQVCRKKGKPVIVATQMLHSMINNPTPTRAEATDVATAAYIKTDAVMLSAESATGDFPIESVQIMSKILNRVVEDQKSHGNNRHNLKMKDHFVTTQHQTMISSAAAHIVDELKAAAIVVYTVSGSTALQLAQYRKMTPIIAITASLKTARKMTLVWGTHPIFLLEKQDNELLLVDTAIHHAFHSGIATYGESIIITGSRPFGGQAGSTNMMLVTHIPQMK